MFDLIWVSFRNIGRNKRRTYITMFTVFIGVMLGSGIRGLLNGFQDEIKSSLSKKIHGDVQIHLDGYKDAIEANPFQMMFALDDQLSQKILHTPSYKSFTSRVRVLGLLNHQKSQSTTPVMITGIDSRREQEVCPRLASAIVEGKMLDSSLEQDTRYQSDDSLEESGGLDGKKQELSHTTASTGYHQIVLTPSLMRGMKASIGDEMVLLFQDKNNMQQAVVATIVGVLDFAVPGTNARMAWMDLSTLQKTLNLRNFVSEVAIQVQSDKEIDAFKVVLQEKLGKTFVVEKWLDLAGFFRDVMALQDLFFSIILAIVFVIVISAIVNTSLMTVMERTKEIGTLMALGYQRKHLIFMFLCEAVIIGASGGVAGIFVVGSAMVGLNVKGLNFTLPGQSVSTILYPWLSPKFVIFVFVLAVISALIASFIPAYRASKMTPVQALAQN